MLYLVNFARASYDLTRKIDTIQKQKMENRILMLVRFHIVINNTQKDSKDKVMCSC